MVSVESMNILRTQNIDRHVGRSPATWLGCPLRHVDKWFICIVVKDIYIQLHLSQEEFLFEGGVSVFQSRSIELVSHGQTIDRPDHCFGVGRYR